MADNENQIMEIILTEIRELRSEINNVNKATTNIRVDIATLKEGRASMEQLRLSVLDCQKVHSDKMYAIDKELAIKSGKWGVFGSIVTLLVVLLIAYLSGALNREPQVQNNTPYQKDEFNTRSGKPIIRQDTLQIFNKVE